MAKEPPTYLAVTDVHKLHDIFSTDGEVIQLQHPKAPSWMRWIGLRVRPMGLEKVVLKNVSERHGQSLRINQVGSVDFHGQEGPWAQFKIEFHNDGKVSLRSIGHKDKSMYLAVDAAGNLTGKATNGADGQWNIAVVPMEVRPYMAGLQAQSVHSPVFFEEWDLSIDQIKYFMDHGLLQVTQVVPPPLVNKALVLINKKLGEPGALEYNEHGQAVFNNSLGGHEDILNLLYASPAYTLAQRLMGRGKVNKPCHAQIALRFPEDRDPPREVYGHSWHVDGMEKEAHSSFTLLFGITLSDCLEDWAGNFTVFPGSHKINLEDLRTAIRAGKLPSSIMHDNKRSFAGALQVKARSGDIVMAHHKLAHKGGDNCSPHIRYQIYFRLCHVDHEKMLDACLDDLFAEFEGVRAKMNMPSIGGSGAAATSPAPPAAAPPQQPAPPIPAPYVASPAIVAVGAPPVYTATPAVYPPSPYAPQQPQQPPPLNYYPPVGNPMPVVNTAFPQQLNTLLMMGFDTVRSQQALQATNGDINAALDRLVSNKM